MNIAITHPPAKLVDYGNFAPLGDSEQENIDLLTGKSKDSKSKEKEKEKDANKELSSVQAVATLGVAVIALGEETGAEMCTRIFGQLVRLVYFYNETNAHFYQALMEHAYI